ncbi:hypothetical protein [Winogradskyella ouciana]|uniref:Uncharacterized protein n=1 Tax=Winogradskyella ouciana TaxID=2608631 RepID=A0A7K1GCL4_9FLAO|nr:hypothetical protein [Winogradskyella ouciana]MTE27042.1 hypothetical protein [Winogradskyella ouciana]
MKFLFSLLTIIMLNESCNSTKEATLNTREAETSVSNKKMQDSIDDQMVIEYRASTRGFFELITIKGDSISFTNDYNIKRINTFAIPAEEKEEFNRLLSELDITTLSELEAPSKTHQYDAAPAAFLKVTKGDEKFMSPSFDHGKPPKAISDIIEKILSIKSLFEKQ